ncbi:replication-relaxation family protein [Meiothermus sp. Pnk-1]|uniref:replication-relaxation family protein n=1 Tax=Meiothermus sp. Pnk-1 TaxID=873128 RepID=UPI000D7D2104|nr:replication-relaxation family protein [Meiothermus sp. Pnk-1]PZA07418.1 hypothetical protein DNA98_07250 [Meiothermus sp. Pnk-1]
MQAKVLRGGERQEALECIRLALGCDLALSEGQLMRHYGVTPSEREAHAMGLHVVRAVLNPSHHANRLLEVRFFTPYLWVARLGPPLLRHLAGVGEMRHILGVPPSSWRTDTHRIHYREQPDAYWYAPEGPIAVEYDAGSYSVAQLARKVEAFALRFVGQRWGAPTPRKAASLRGKLAGLGLEPGHVMAAPWW